MLSTRLTGSSTSITSASMRSARSTGSSAPGAANQPAAKARRGVAVRRVRQERAHPGVVAVEERAGVGGQPVAGRVEHRRVPVVAAEHLVGALAGLHDLAVAGHLLAEQVEGHRVVGHHRLAHRRDGLRQRLHEPLGPDPDLPVLRPELARDEVGEGELVALAVARVREADRERGQPALARLGEQRDDQRRVQPAREQHADGDVGHHAPLHGGAQRGEQRRLPVGRRPVRPLGVAAERRVPPAPLAPPPVGLAHEQRVPAAACAPRAGSSAARGRSSAGSGSGAARPGRPSCRARRPRAARAASRRSAARPPARPPSRAA